MDRISKEQRSWNMSRIRSRNTKPEMAVRKYLYSKGIRYRLHGKLPGKPDIVMKRRKIALFINGCFWHGHSDCKYFRLPKSRQDYWVTKISDNISRDKRNFVALEEAGWRHVVIWECQIKHSCEDTLNRFYSEIMQTNMQNQS
jgi:DNA mismatch endonuclease, patch repair protein